MRTRGTPPPRTVIGDPSQARGQGRNREWTFSDLPSLCGTEGNAVGHHAIAHEVPERDQELARQGHDHLLARAAGVLGASSVPLSQGAVLLEPEKAPGQLDQSPPDPSVAASS